MEAGEGRSVVDLAAEAGGEDPATGLAAVAALRRLLEELEAVHVEAARRRGWSWEAIAAALGVKRQSAHKKHARRIAAGDRRGT
ncbi:helix-turn-helix domain-containing protein [Bailinhaonella thermotolerans]|uniref:Helix-turn-helix domain-containing protein n=1 Tax=Bailinhaonella thermotolerans TaxID=1070861 RepID=A0A3A4A771_9ACTN|nr:helix-turn-helix domain-containing protein [Bailinhaonella thermotolerans]RJL24806.1 helix-turn-helix domain-containing protein [Bailinhaonella thermotolerans]